MSISGFDPGRVKTPIDAMIPWLNRRGEVMKGFVQGADRQQTTLLPECLDDWVDESNPVRAVDVFVDALELRDLGFGYRKPRSLRRSRLLQRRGDSGMRGGRHHGHAAKTSNIGREVGRALRQAGLPLCG